MRYISILSTISINLTYIEHTRKKSYRFDLIRRNCASIPYPTPTSPRHNAIHLHTKTTLQYMRCLVISVIITDYNHAKPYAQSCPNRHKKALKYIKYPKAFLLLLCCYDAAFIWLNSSELKTAITGTFSNTNSQPSALNFYSL